LFQASRHLSQVWELGKSLKFTTLEVCHLYYLSERQTDMRRGYREVIKMTNFQCGKLQAFS